MKKLFLLGAAALCAMTMSAQKMQVKSDGSVVFERNVNAVDEVTFEDADPDAVEVGFKDVFLTMDWSEEVNIADILLTNNVELDAVTVTSSDPLVVAVEGGKLVAKDYGIVTVFATATGVTTPAKLTVSVESNALMYVEDVYTITGRGTVVTGTILSGNIRLGQPIIHGSILDDKGNTSTIVRGIDLSRVAVDVATAGDAVGLLLATNVLKEDVNRGDVFIGKNYRNVVRSKTIKGTVYVYTKEEGGRHQPILLNYGPEMYVSGASFKARVTDLGTINGEVPEYVIPGSTCENMVFEIIQRSGTDDDPVYQTPFTYIGQEVLLRESGRTVAKVTITGY